MGVVYCRSCGIANSDAKQRCHCCGSELPAPGILTVRASATGAVFEDYVVRRRRQRNALARSASRALLVAAAILCIGVGLYPVLKDYNPVWAGWAFDSRSVTSLTFILVAALGLAAVFARRQPLTAAVLAWLLYLGASAPDALGGPAALRHGAAGRALVVLMLLRALTAGLSHSKARRANAL